MSETTSGVGDSADDAPDDADDVAGGDDDELTGEAGQPEPGEDAADDATALAGGDKPPERPTPAARKSRSETIRESAAAKAAAASTEPAPRRRGRGRTTPKGGGPPARAVSRTGRYTHPIPKERRQSPPWYPFVLLAFLILGLLTIVLNYVNVLPGGTNNWYLIGGIVAIVVGLFMATFYH